MPKLVRITNVSSHISTLHGTHTMISVATASTNPFAKWGLILYKFNAVQGYFLIKTPVNQGCYTAYPPFTIWQNLSIAPQPFYPLEDKGKVKPSSFPTMHPISSDKDSVSFWSLIYRCCRAIVLTACQSPRKQVADIFQKHPKKKRSVIKSILSITSAMSRSRVQGLLLNGWRMLCSNKRLLRK